MFHKSVKHSEPDRNLSLFRPISPNLPKREKRIYTYPLATADTRFPTGKIPAKKKDHEEILLPTANDPVCFFIAVPGRIRPAHPMAGFLLG